MPHTGGNPKNVKRHIDIMAFLAILDPSVTESAGGKKVLAEGRMDRSLPESKR